MLKNPPKTVSNDKKSSAKLQDTRIYKFQLYFYKPVINNMKMKLREYSQHHRKVLNSLE